VARSDAVVAADGAVALLERIWPALQSIDGSLGALGNAVYGTVHALIPLVVAAPADMKTRTAWLERMYEAVVEDGVDYLAPVQDHWGQLCVFPDLAGQRADRLTPAV